MSRTVPYKETLTVEFKSDLKKYGDNDLFEDVVAFANAEGGDLYLGVKTMEQLQVFIQISPTPLPSEPTSLTILFLLFPHDVKLLRKRKLF